MYFLRGIPFCDSLRFTVYTVSHLKEGRDGFNLRNKMNTRLKMSREMNDICIK